MECEPGTGVFQDHVTTDRRNGLIFAQLVDAVSASRCWAEYLEHHHDSGYYSIGPWYPSTGHKGVGIADRVADGSDACIRPEWLATGASQSCAQGRIDVAGDPTVINGTASHRDRLEPVELI